MKDDIIRMARDAVLVIDGNNSGEDDLFVFVNLVAAAVREACAALLEENAMACENPAYRSLLQANAQAIRARGQG